MTTATARRTRVLVAKPGLDGHDVGAKVVAQALVDAGMEVIYTGLRRTPAEIAETAVQEDVDVVGLSILSGAHLPLCAAVADELRRRGRADALLVVGGVIPRRDREALAALGCRGVFGVGSRTDEIVKFIRENAR
jgi:methylmalonyl-CoA mutase C-terminal domain/subunit